jgi:DNA repair protein RecO (recombination protein O)
MNNEWLTAFVLHRRAYRETSYIVDFFTLEQGKVSAVAKGVRNSKSDRKSLLQPFQALKLQLAGKSELKNLRQLEGAAPPIPLVGTALFCAMYINEITNRIMPVGLPSDGAFTAYTNALTSLHLDSDIEVCLRQFERALLDEMGLMPDLTTDVEWGEPISGEHLYSLQPELGFCRAPKGHRHALPGAALMSLAYDQYTPLSKKVAKVLYRELLKPLVGDKPLKSRELFAHRKPK